jgi:hypothetical protein
MSGLLRELKMEQRGCVLKAFKILDTAGTPSLTVGSPEGVITDVGVGIYTITFTTPFERVMGAQVTAGELNAMACVTALSKLAVTVKVTNQDGATAVDSDLYVWVMGSLAADET